MTEEDWGGKGTGVGGWGHTSQQEGQSQSMGISPEGFFTEDEIFSLQTSAPSESMLARP